MPLSVNSRTYLFGFLFVIIGLLVAGILLLREPRYVIQIDDEYIAVSGSYDKVRTVLAAAGISTRSEDLIFPPPESDIEPNSVILIEKSQPLSLIDGGTKRNLWTLQPDLATFLSEAGITVFPGDRILADGRLIPFAKIEGTPLPDKLEIERNIEVQIIDGDREFVFSTLARTVGEAISEAGLSLRTPDKIEPAAGSWLMSGQTATITRAEPYTILVDGEDVKSYSQSGDTLDILASVGVGLSGRDYTVPEFGPKLEPGDQIEVIRVQEQYEIEDVPIPFGSALVASNELEIDQKAFLSEGVPGNLRKVTKLRFENGRLTEQTDVGEWVTRQPVDELTGYGTKIVVRTLETPEGPQEYWRVVTMRATSYTAASSGKPANHPTYGITASGVPAGYGVVAIDPAVVPFRSHIYVQGYGVGFAGDTGGSVKGRIIDFGYDDGALESWRGFVDVYYLTPVPSPENINYLIP